MEGITKKSQVTIKERIEKKLANMSIEEIRAKMQSGKDISFKDKKPNIKSKGDPQSVLKPKSGDEPENTEPKCAIKRMELLGEGKISNKEDQS